MGWTWFFNHQPESRCPAALFRAEIIKKPSVMQRVLLEGGWAWGMSCGYGSKLHEHWVPTKFNGWILFIICTNMYNIYILRAAAPAADPRKVTTQLLPMVILAILCPCRLRLKWGSQAVDQEECQNVKKDGKWMTIASKSSQSHSQALCRNRPLNYPLHVRFKDVQRECQFIEDAKALLHVIACYCMLLHVIAIIWFHRKIGIHQVELIYNNNKYLYRTSTVYMWVLV